MIRLALQMVMVIFLALGMGCKSAEKCAVEDDSQSITAKSPTPKRVYVPEYYRYHNGKYTFVKGHYRRVVAKKAQHKRTLRGYTTHSDYTSIR
jgi:hypothetical protein